MFFFIFNRQCNVTSITDCAPVKITRNEPLQSIRCCKVIPSWWLPRLHVAVRIHYVSQTAWFTVNKEYLIFRLSKKSHFFIFLPFHIVRNDMEKCQVTHRRYRKTSQQCYASDPRVRNTKPLTKFVSQCFIY